MHDSLTFFQLQPEVAFLADTVWWVPCRAASHFTERALFAPCHESSLKKRPRENCGENVLVTAHTFCQWGYEYTAHATEKLYVH